MELLSALMTSMEGVYLSLFWGVLGVFLIIFEMIIPGFFLLLIGMSALCTALIVYMAPITATISWVLFATLSLVILFLTRHFYKHFFKFTSPLTLNQRGADLVGKMMILEDPIQNGRGHLRIGDSIWAIQGDDMVSGTHVIITGIEGNHLVVEKTS